LRTASRAATAGFVFAVGVIVLVWQAVRNPKTNNAIVGFIAIANAPHS
jgi:hypothetical protein